MKVYFNPNSLDNKGSWKIFKDLYCSVTMLRELGLVKHKALYPCYGLFYTIESYLETLNNFMNDKRNDCSYFLVEKCGISPK